MAFNDELLVCTLEAAYLHPHLFQHFGLQVTLLWLHLRLWLEIVHEDGLDSQQNDQEKTVLRNISLSAHQKNLSQFGIKWQK